MLPRAARSLVHERAHPGMPGARPLRSLQPTSRPRRTASSHHASPASRRQLSACARSRPSTLSSSSSLDTRRHTLLAGAYLLTASTSTSSPRLDLSRRNFSLWPSSSSSSSGPGSGSSPDSLHLPRDDDASPISSSSSSHTDGTIPPSPSTLPPSSSSSSLDDFSLQPPPPPVEPSLSDPSSFIHDVVPADQLGHLASLGLDFGWGPTAVISSIFEHVHVYTGLPWWATFAVSGVLVRLALWSPVQSSMENGRRLTALQQDPYFKVAQDKVKANLAMGGNFDKTEHLALSKYAKMQKQKHDVRLLRSFVPLVFQLPLGFGAFKATRAMASIPVPSLETEGVLWFHNLAVADPYFILAFVSPAVMYYTLRFNARDQSPEMAKNMHVAAMVFIPVSLFFTVSFPAALHLYFIPFMLLSTVQTVVTRQEWYRRLLRMPPLPPPPPPKPAGPSGSGVKRFLGGPVQGLKSWYNDLDVVQQRKEAAAKTAQQNADVQAVKRRVLDDLEDIKKQLRNQQ